MGPRSDATSRAQTASPHHIAVPVEVLTSHHADVELVLQLGAASNALATALRLYRALGDDGADARALGPSRRTHESRMERVQLFLLSAFHRRSHMVNATT